jgi:hypothetical protein
MQLIEQVASDEIIEQAFSWLCLKRKEHCHNNGVWNLRRHWQTIKPNLQQQLLDALMEMEENLKEEKSLMSLTKRHQFNHQHKKLSSQRFSPQFLINRVSL